VSYVINFDQFVLDAQRRTVICNGLPISLTPKAFDILLFLAENPNRLVSKEELMKAVWPETFVEEGNLTQNISLLRKALGEGSDGLIVTVARKGYQFTPDVVRTESAAFQPPLALASRDGGGGAANALSSAAAPSRSKSGLWLRVAIPIAIAILAVSGYMLWRSSQLKGAPQKVMLAVLPFQNLTGDPNQEYLADGLTEALIAKLGRLQPSELGVIARTSVMGYKHTDQRVDQIGRDLAVQYVLESSLRRGPGRLRITVQLLQVKDQSHLWAADYDYSPGDTLTLQDDVSVAVAREIKLRFTSPAPVERLPRPAAFDAYLQGRYFFQRSSAKEDLDRAVSYYEQAIKLDPDYAAALVELSRVLFRQADKGFIPAEEGFQRAREAANHALELDTGLAEAHAQLAWIKEFHDWDWNGADTEFQRALALAPGDSKIVSQAATMSVYLGRFDKALELENRAVQLDPLNALSRGSRGQHLYFAGRLEDAASDLKRCLQLNPDVPHAHQVLGLVYLATGHQQEALAEINAEPSVRWQFQGQALVYHALNREGDAERALADYIAKYKNEAAYEIAEIYAFRNENAKAFEWLERAYTQRDAGLVALKVDPLVRGLHTDPRYRAMLEKLRLSD
jgi:TolB-like protein/DNA-binding winged helix-turn-helix (wHTH) protein/cytochrome c-type biogenesis protein CcmH/NrfG